MKNKLLFIGSFQLPKNGHYGGVYHASTTLRDGLKEQGYEVIELDTTVKDISDMRISKRIPSLALRMLSFSWAMIRHFSVKKVFVFQTSGTSYIDRLLPLFFAKLLGKKIYLFPRSGYLVKDIERKSLRFPIKTVLKMSNTIVCQSDFWLKFFISHGIDEKKLTVVENWVKPELLTLSKTIKSSSYANNESFRLVFISRIEKDKGADLLLPLFERIKSEGVDCQIDVFGAGSYVDEFLTQIKELKLENYIHFKGWLGDGKHETISEYHAAIFPTKVEGYPNTLLDFIFAKTPVITTDLPMIREVFGKKIRYFEMDNVDDLFTQVISLKDAYPQAIEGIEELYEIHQKKNNLQLSIQNLIKLIEK